MTKEYWYIAGGILLILLPLAWFALSYAKHRLDTRPDQEIVYKTVAGQELKLHAFYAAQSTDHADEPRPALLLLHGGRWLYGTPAAFYPQCQYFTAKGYHCFSAQYRLGSNDQVDVRELVADAQNALQYLIDHASELNINPGKIAMGGGSSGGQLAAAVGVAVPVVTALGAPLPPRPAALILYNPMLDLAPGTPDHPLVEDYWQSVSPQHHIDDATPPTLILVGDNDPEVPVPTAQAFCDTMSAVGGYCELQVYEGQSHGFFNGEPYLQKTNVRVDEFLQVLGLR